MNKEQKIKMISALAKDKYEQFDLSFLWGCSQVLLQENQIDIILSMLDKGENK